MSFVVDSICNQKVLLTIIPTLNKNTSLALNSLLKKLENQGNEIILLSNSEQIHEFNFLYEFNLRFKPTRRSRNICFVFYNKLLILKWFYRIRFKNKSIKYTFKFLHNKISRANYFESELKIDCVLCWNIYCDTFGVYADYFKWRGKKAYTIEYGPFPGSLIVDDGFIVDSKNLREYKPTKIELNQPTSIKNIKDTNLYKLNDPVIPNILKSSNKVIIVFLGLSEIDSGVYPNWYTKERKLFYPYFKNGLDGAISIARSMKNINIIYKPHPNHNRNSEDKRLLENLWIINGSALPLIELADAVIGNGTKVENDVILSGKPLINFGAGYCKSSGLSFVIQNFEDLNCVIQDLVINQNFEYNPESVKKWFTYLNQLAIR